MMKFKKVVLCLKLLVKICLEIVFSVESLKRALGHSNTTVPTNSISSCLQFIVIINLNSTLNRTRIRYTE